MSVKLSPDSIVQGTTDGQKQVYTYSVHCAPKKYMYMMLVMILIIMTKIMMRIRRVSLIRLPGKGIPGPRFPWDSQSLSPIHPNINIVNIVIIIIIAIHPNIIAIIIRPRPIFVDSILDFSSLYKCAVSKALCVHSVPLC